VRTNRNLEGQQGTCGNLKRGEARGSVKETRRGGNNVPAGELQKKKSVGGVHCNEGWGGKREKGPVRPGCGWSSCSKARRSTVFPCIKLPEETLDDICLRILKGKTSIRYLPGVMAFRLEVQTTIGERLEWGLPWWKKTSPE